MSKEHIYALYRQWGESRIYFYVGRSKRDPEIRFKEHSRNARNEKHTEDVYRYIREHATRCDIQFFEHEILCWCEDDNVDDYEDFYVVKLIRAGHDLQNMKHGDAKRIAAEELAHSDEVINSVKDVRAYKERKARDAAALRASIRAEVPIRAGMQRILDWTEQYREAKAEENQIKAERAEKKAQAKAAKAADYQVWLNEQRNLFEEQRASNC